MDQLVSYVFEGLRRWDAVYLTHVAEHGYTYENTLAFFPLYPLTLRVIANVIFVPSSPLISYTTAVLISGVGLNFALFCVTALSLHELSKIVLQDSSIAFKATLLFCINPASIFFSACYSETMFAFCTFQGLLFLHKKQHVKAAGMFGLSCLIRSNGLVNVGFVLYTNFNSAYKLFSVGIRTTKLDYFKQLARILLLSVFQIGLCVGCFLLFQYYTYELYCSNSIDLDLSKSLVAYGQERGYKMPRTNTSEWCDYRIPLSYSYIQDKHWNVGFMKYYQFKQIPNFVLAAPMILLCASAIIYYVVNNFSLCLTLGLRDENKYKYKKQDGDCVPLNDSGYLRSDVFVYIVHLAFLVSFAALMMHIQVRTVLFFCLLV